MLKFAAFASLASILMLAPAEAAKVVKTTIINPPGPGIIVKKSVRHVAPPAIRPNVRTVIVNPPGPNNSFVRHVVVRPR